MADRAPRSLSIPDEVRAEVEAHLRSALPDEGCGLFVGSGEVVVGFVPVTNVDPSPSTFTLDPVEHHRALLGAESEGRELVGVVHSHPRSEAVPSATDIAGALEPEWVYVVVGPLDGDPEMRGWVIDGGVAVEVPLRDALTPGSS